jgi:HAD superfamily hydrolase (TIGR01509 family)
MGIAMSNKFMRRKYKPKYTTIVFDFTGVIMEGPLFTWARQNLSPNDEKYLFMMESAHKWDMGEISLSEAYQIMSQITGIAPEAIWQTFYEESVLNSGVINVIRRLRKHYKIILFSNHLGELLRRILLVHKISDLFEEIYISSEYKMKKPDVRFYEVMLSAINAQKDAIVFIDDTQTNIQAALNIGIQAILYNNPDQLIYDLERIGVKL